MAFSCASEFFCLFKQRYNDLNIFQVFDKIFHIFEKILTYKFFQTSQIIFVILKIFLKLLEHIGFGQTGIRRIVESSFGELNR